MKATQTYILGAMLITVTDAAISNLIGEGSGKKAPAVRIVVGGWLVTVVLLAVSDSQPDLVAGFATLIMLGSIFGPNGAAILKVVQRVMDTAKIPLRSVPLQTYGSTIGSGVPVSGSLGVSVGMTGSGNYVKPTLVKIGQGGHSLAANAATAFANWEHAYGGDILVTDSYRSYEQQLRDYQSDPNRFGHPDKSQHPKGLAVDVNLQAMNAIPPPPHTATVVGGGGTGNWQKLYRTGIANGWKNVRGPYSPNSDQKEPWHWQYTP